MLSRQVYCYILLLTINLIALLAPRLTENSYAVTPESFKSFLGVSFMLFMLLLWFFQSNNKNVITMAKTNFYYPVIGFLLWCTLSLIWAFNTEQSLLAIAQYSSMAIAMFLIINTIEKDEEIKIFFIILLVCSLLVATLGLLQVYFPDNNGIQTFIRQAVKPGSTFGNKNMAIHYIVLSIPISLILFLQAVRISRILFYIFIFTIQIWFLVMSSTRAGWLATIIVVVALMVFLLFDFFNNKQNPLNIDYKNGKKNKITKPAILITSLIITFFLINLSPNGFSFQNTENIQNRFSDISLSSIEKKGTSAYVRIPGWLNTLVLIKDNFIRGVGVNNWETYYPLYYDSLKKDQIFNEVVRMQRLHNTYLEMFASVGFIGYVFLIALLVLIINTSFKILYDANYKNRYFILAMILSMTGFSVTAIFSFPIRVYSPGLFVLAFIGIIANYYFRHNSPIRPKIKPKQIENKLILPNKNYFILSNRFIMPSRILLFVLFIFMSVICFWWIKAEHYYHTSLLFEATQPKKTLEYANLSIENNPINTRALVLLGNSYLRNNNPKEAIKNLEKSLKYNPFQTPPLLNLAVAYQNIGDKDNFFKTLEKLIKVDPRSFKGNYLLTQHYIDSKDQKNMKKYYERTKESYLYFAGRSQFGPYNDLMKLLADSFKDYDFLKKFYQTVINYYSNNDNHKAESYKNIGLLYYNYPKDGIDQAKSAAYFKKAIELNPNISDNGKLKLIIKHYQSQATQSK